MSRTNNPFAPTPASEVELQATKYPDLSSEVQQFAGYQQQGGQQQQQQYQQQYQQPQQQQTGYQQQPSYIQSQPTGFQPQSSFGQQLTTQTGYGGGYGQQQQGYTNQYSQQSTPQVQFSVNDLDPYAGGGLDSLASRGSNQQGGGGAGSRALPGNLTNVQQTVAHPRQYVHEQKSQLMTWDEYAWKQLLSRVDSLREGWESRKSAIQQLGNQGGDPTSVDKLKRDTDNYIDSIHAAKMQLTEVKEGWRHSTDAASKARVREALNAGLSSLPEYPPPLTAEQIGGAYHQRAYEDYRKLNIMAGYQGQGQGQGGMQAQQTGYGGGYGQLQGQGQQVYGQQGYSTSMGMGMGMQAQPTGMMMGGSGYMQQPQQQQPQQTGYYGGQPGMGMGGYGQQQYYG